MYKFEGTSDEAKDKIVKDLLYDDIIETLDTLPVIPIVKNNSSKANNRMYNKRWNKYTGNYYYR